jgi:hypothetical protein
METIIAITVIGSVSYASYLYGKDQGYDQAKKELYTMAKKAAVKTISYTKKDIERTKSGFVVDKVYMKDRAKISLLPRWELELLGDKYIVRQPLREEWDTAWLMTESDSRDLDYQIELSLMETVFHRDQNTTNIVKKEINKKIHTYIDERVNV